MKNIPKQLVFEIVSVIAIAVIATVAFGLLMYGMGHMAIMVPRQQHSEVSR